jgi:hypothetical protein
MSGRTKLWYLKNLDIFSHLRDPWNHLLKRYLVTSHPSGINRFRYGIGVGGRPVNARGKYLRLNDIEHRILRPIFTKFKH